jgi:hypothetical protein
MIFVDPELIPTLIASFKFLSPAVRTRLCVDAPVGIRFTTMVIAAGDVNVDGMIGYESLIGDGVFEEEVARDEVKTRTTLMCT